MTSDRLIEVRLDDAGAPPPTPEEEQERAVAIFDLLEENSFALPGGPPGPYRLTLSLRERRLTFDLTDEAGARAAAPQVALGPLRQVIRDYHAICDSYFDAVKHLPPSRIEAVDEARRVIHASGAALLSEKLAAEVDEATSRRLFTLVCALAPSG